MSNSANVGCSKVNVELLSVDVNKLPFPFKGCVFIETQLTDICIDLLPFVFMYPIVNENNASISIKSVREKLMKTFDVAGLHYYASSVDTLINYVFKTLYNSIYSITKMTPHHLVTTHVLQDDFLYIFYPLNIGEYFESINGVQKGD